MPSLKKFLSKFNENERKIIESLVKEVISFNWRKLDVKKLKGYQNIFRVRWGKIRIIFTKNNKDIFIIAIERRRENIYKF